MTTVNFPPGAAAISLRIGSRSTVSEPPKLIVLSADQINSAAQNQQLRITRLNSRDLSMDEARGEFALVVNGKDKKFRFHYKTLPGGKTISLIVSDPDIPGKFNEPQTQSFNSDIAINDIYSFMEILNDAIVQQQALH